MPATLNESTSRLRVFGALTLTIALMLTACGSVEDTNSNGDNGGNNDDAGAAADAADSEIAWEAPEDLEGSVTLYAANPQGLNEELAEEIAEDLFAGFAAAGLPTALIGGNHDVESPLTAQLRLPDSVQWVGQGELGLEAPGTVVWEQWRIAVHGQAVRDKDELRDLAAGYPKPVEGMWNLGLLHTSLTGQWSNRACAPTTLETLYAAGYDSWILGHVHQPMVMASRPLIAYPGSVHTHKVGEPGGEGFALLHLENHTNPRIEFRRLPVVTA